MSEALAPHMKRRRARQAGVVRVIGRAKLNSWIRTLAANLAVTYVARPVVTWIMKRMRMMMMNQMMIDDLGNLDYDDFGHVYSRVVYQPSSLFVNSINNV